MNKTLFSLGNPYHLLATGFGSGLSPVAPGTVGALAAIPIYLLFLQGLSGWGYLLVLIASFVAGIKICDKTSLDLGVHDHPGIVWDEFVGLWIALFLAPKGWEWVLLGFMLFRLFDIWKPWPIGRLDREVSGGLGIMLDDLVAGLMAWGCLQGIHYLVKQI